MPIKKLFFKTGGLAHKAPDSAGRESTNAEGVLYDLKKLQKSLFNQKRRREVDPVLVQRHTANFHEYFRKMTNKNRHNMSGKSLNTGRLESDREFAQVTGKVFEFNQDFNHLQPSQLALSAVSTGSNESGKTNNSGQ